MFDNDLPDVMDQAQVYIGCYNRWDLDWLGSL